MTPASPHKSTRGCKELTVRDGRILNIELSVKANNSNNFMNSNNNNNCVWKKNEWLEEGDWASVKSAAMSGVPALVGSAKHGNLMEWEVVRKKDSQKSILIV
jgi:hypothetical protein